MEIDWSQRLERAIPEPSSIVLWAAIVLVETLIVLSYVEFVNAQLLPLHVYPFVWLNLSAWVLWHASPPPAPRRTKWAARGLAGVYFLVIAYFGGMLQTGYAFSNTSEVPTDQLVTGLGLLIELPPGYSPALTYSGYYVTSTVMPYMLVGFLALSYLVYAAILSARASATAGLIGIFSCVGCSFPLVAALLSGGAASTVAAFVYSRAYTLSTIVFALTLLVLYWQNQRATSGDATCETCQTE